MKTPISQTIPKIREKLAAHIENVQRFNDGVLSEAVKAVISMNTFWGKRFHCDESGITPGIDENSKEEQKLILKACLIFQGQLHPDVVQKLEVELYKLENGDEYFMGVQIC